jgi:hypothetical protein
MRQAQLARHDFRRFSSGVTPAIRNPSMRPEDARKDVHFHQFFYRINADKTIEPLCGKHHTTVMHSIAKIDHERRTDPEVDRAIGMLLKTLNLEPACHEFRDKTFSA